MNFIPRQLERLEAEFTVPKATFIVALLTLLSRISGLIRTRLLTSTFGAGETLDVYFAAFRIPDFIMNLLVLGTLTVALLPVFTKYLVVNKSRAYTLASNIISLSLAGMVIVCLVVLVFLEPLTHWLVPGFTATQVAETIILTRLILLAQIIFAVSNLYTVVLNAHKRFFIAALAPVLYNVGIILGLLVFYEKFGVHGLGYGVLLGSVMHLLFQAVESARLGFVYSLRPRFDREGIAQVVTLYIPRIFFLDLSQISLMVASVLGSMLLSGSITVFNLAFDLQAVPTGIFAISTAIAAFPVLSETFAAGNTKRYWDILAKACIQILFFIIPISVGILIFRAYIVRLLFGSGAFNWEDTIATFQVLGIFSFSLFSQALVPLFSRAFYARHNTTVPMIVGFLTIAVNVCFSYVLALRFGIVGVAYGFTIASILNLVVLYGLLRRMLVREAKANPELLHAFDAKIVSDFIKIIIASLVLGVVSFIALRLFAPLVSTNTGMGILIQSGLSALLGGIAFLAVSELLEVEESKRLTSKIKGVYRYLVGK